MKKMLRRIALPGLLLLATSLSTVPGETVGFCGSTNCCSDCNCRLSQCYNGCATNPYPSCYSDCHFYFESCASGCYRRYQQTCPVP